MVQCPIQPHSSVYCPANPVYIGYCYLQPSMVLVWLWFKSAVSTVSPVSDLLIVCLSAIKQPCHYDSAVFNGAIVHPYDGVPFSLYDSAFFCFYYSAFYTALIIAHSSPFDGSILFSLYDCTLFSLYGSALFCTTILRHLTSGYRLHQPL